MDIEKQLKSNHEKAYLWALQCCDFDRERAQDILQDSYLKILEGRAVFKGQSSFKTWLFSIIRHTSIDAWRKQSRYKQLVQLLKPEKPVLKKENTSKNKEILIKQLLTQLSPKQRELITLVFYHEMTIESAAEVMHISLGTARTHYERGKHKLKSLIQKERLQNIHND